MDLDVISLQIRSQHVSTEKCDVIILQENQRVWMVSVQFVLNKEHTQSSDNIILNYTEKFFLKLKHFKKTLH